MTGELWKKPIMAMAALSVLAGCVTTGNTPNRPLTVAEQKMRQEAEVYNSTLLEGALIGCALGALVGFTSSNKDARTNAAVGCAAGGALGVGAGYYIAEKQKQYADTESQLEAMTLDVRNDNERLAAIVQSSREVIDADKRRIAQIDRDLASGKLTMAQARAEMQAVDANAAYLKNTLATLEQRRDTYVQAAAQTQGSTKARKAMDVEIGKLEKQIAGLESELNGLVARRTISRVG